jgi:hypothetical protein
MPKGAGTLSEDAFVSPMETAAKAADGEVVSQMTEGKIGQLSCGDSFERRMPVREKRIKL